MYMFPDPLKPATVNLSSTSDWAKKYFPDLTTESLIDGSYMNPPTAPKQTSSFAPYTSQENADLFNKGLAAGTAAAGDTPWYQNADMLSSIAGLGSAFAQLAAMPSQIDYAKTQSKALKQNIATAKEEQARRNKNISAFNSFNAG